jgi:hypothetical protein
MQRSLEFRLVIVSYLYKENTYTRRFGVSIYPYFMQMKKTVRLNGQCTSHSPKRLIIFLSEQYRVFKEQFFHFDARLLSLVYGITILNVYYCQRF